MNCQQVQESLGDHSVGLLEASALAAFEAHVARCAECSGSLHAFQRCMDLIDRAPRPTPPPDLWAGIQARLELDRTVASYANASQTNAVTTPWWSGAMAAMAGFAAAAGVLVLLSTQQVSAPAAVATVPPLAVSVSQHSIMDGASPVADGASVMAADVVSQRPVLGIVRSPQVIVPGRVEILGEPLSPAELGALMSTPMGLPGAARRAGMSGDNGQ